MEKAKKKAVKLDDYAHEILRYLSFKENRKMSDIMSELIKDKYGKEYEEIKRIQENK